MDKAKLLKAVENEGMDKDEFVRSIEKAHRNLLLRGYVDDSKGLTDLYGIPPTKKAILDAHDHYLGIKPLEFLEEEKLNFMECLIAYRGILPREKSVQKFYRKNFRGLSQIPNLEGTLEILERVKEVTNYKPKIVTKVTKHKIQIPINEVFDYHTTLLSQGLYAAASRLAKFTEIEPAIDTLLLAQP